MSNLDGSPSYISYGLEDHIVYNTINFLKYGFLEVGAFYNIVISGVNTLGQEEAILSPLSIPGVANYTRYAGSKTDWIWENNITFKATGITAPITISGIFVNSIFYPTGTSILGTGYYVDYARGEVVFSNPLPSGFTVRCARSQRYVNIYPQDSYEYRTLITDINNIFNSSGVTASNETKAFLPAIFVNLDGYETLRGVGLGSRSKVCLADIEFDIFTTNDWDRKKLQDYCYFLESKPVQCFNLSTAPKPLDYNGALVSGTLTWPILSQNYPATNPGYFKENAKVTKFSKTLLPIKHSRVTIGMEIDAYPI